jgi:hypothetical protein
MGLNLLYRKLLPGVAAHKHPVAMALASTVPKPKIAVNRVNSIESPKTGLPTCLLANLEFRDNSARRQVIITRRAFLGPS